MYIHANSHLFSEQMNAYNHSTFDTQRYLLFPPLFLSRKFIANKITIKRGKRGILLTRGWN